MDNPVSTDGVSYYSSGVEEASSNGGRGQHANVLQNLIGNVASPVRSPTSMDASSWNRFRTLWDQARTETETKTKRSVLGFESLRLDEGRRTTTEENAVERGGEQLLPSLSPDLSSLGFVSADSPPIRNNLTQQSSSPHDSSSFDDNGDHPNPVNQYFLNNGNLSLSQGQSAAYDSNHVQRDYNYIPSMSSAYVAPVLQNEPEGFYHNNNAGQNLSNPNHSQGSEFKCQMKELLLNGSIDPLKAAMYPEYSQCLLSLLAGGDAEITNNVLHGVLRSVFELMEDQYGKHLFKTLLNICDDRQKQKLVYKVIWPRNKLVKAAKTPYGRHSVWELIKSVEGSSMLHDVTSALSSRIFDLMINPIGSRLVEDCLCNLNYEDNKFIYRAALKHCDRLARHSHGYVSLKWCIISNSQAPYAEQILNKIIEDSLDLAKDYSGNILIQHVLSIHDPDVSERICSRLKDHVLVLAMDKFGSYVVQKCIQSFGGKQLLEVLAYIGREKIEEIALDQYGNYVLQSALKAKKDMKLHYLLIHTIKEASKSLRYNPNGSKLLNYIEKSIK